MTTELCLHIDKPLRSVELIHPSSGQPEQDVSEGFRTAVEILQDELQEELAALKAEAAQALADREGTLEQDLSAVRSLVAQFGEAVQSVRANDAHLLPTLQQTSVEIGVAIARQLIQKQIATEDFGIQDLVEAALKRWESREPVMGRLHPQDLQLLQLQQEEQEPPGQTRTIDFVADSNLSRGDCICVTRDTRMVVRIQDRLEEIREYLSGEDACWN